MSYLALAAGDWAAVTVIILIMGCVLGGVVKFYQAIQILRRGKPELDPELAREQELEFQRDKYEES